MIESRRRLYVHDLCWLSDGENAPHTHTYVHVYMTCLQVPVGKYEL